MKTQIPALDPRDVKEISSILAPLLTRHTDARLKLFGSRARGDARRTSDIDLALCADRLPAAEIAGLREALEDSLVPFRIDLVDYATAPPELRTAIELEGITWPA